MTTVKTARPRFDDSDFKKTEIKSMPIYEYDCGRCGHRFEEFVHSSEQKVKCPICKSTKISKVFSLFSSSGGCSPFGGHRGGG